MGTRNVEQVRNRANYSSHSDDKKEFVRGRWSELEELMLTEGVKLFGGNFREISEFMGTRSSNQILHHNYYYKRPDSKVNLNEEEDWKRNVGRLSVEEKSKF